MKIIPVVLISFLALGAVGYGYVKLSSDAVLHADINKKVMSALDRDQSPTPIKFLSTLEAHTLFRTRKALFLDARPERDFQYLHIPGARSVFYQDAKRNLFLKTIKRDQLIVVYCASAQCPMAELLANSLHELQFKRVYVYSGGMKEWMAAKYPTQRFQFPDQL